MEQCFDKEKRFQKIFEPEGRRSGFYNLQRNEYGAGAQTDRYHFYLQKMVKNSRYYASV